MTANLAAALGRADWEQAARDRCEQALAGLDTLRAAFQMPAHGTDPDVVHERLTQLRGALDQADTVMDELARFRGELRRISRDKARAADEAYDAELDRLAKRAVTREYESIRDREVQARVKVLELRQAANAAQRLADVADEAWDRAKSRYFTLKDLRRELIVTLEYFVPWERSIERT